MTPFWQRGKDKSQGRVQAGEDSPPPPMPSEEPRPTLDEVVLQVDAPSEPSRPAEDVEVAPPSFLPPSASAQPAPAATRVTPDTPGPAFSADGIEPVAASSEPIAAEEAYPGAESPSAEPVAPTLEEPALSEPAAIDQATLPSHETPVAAESAVASEGPQGEPSAAEPSESATIASLAAAVAELTEGLARFEGRLDVAIKGNEWGRSALNKLADETDTYRKNFLADAQLPLLKRLCTYHGSIEKVAASETIAPSDFDFLAEQVLDILADHGIEPFSDPVGEKLVGKRHRGLKALPTDRLELDGTIGETVTKGWLAGEKVITSQVVYVYKYEAATAQASDAATVSEAEPVSEEAVAGSSGAGEGLSSEDEGGSNE